MDGAAQDVAELVQHVLPARPHHLALSPLTRYPVPAGAWPLFSPLQYTTYISEADRGVLLTRPYYDIVQYEVTKNGNWTDPANSTLTGRAGAGGAAPSLPPGADAASSSRSSNKNANVGLKKPVNKLSFKDYQQSKQQKRLSDSATPKVTDGNTKTTDAQTAAMASVERQRSPAKHSPENDRASAPVSKSPKPPSRSPDTVDRSRKRGAEQAAFADRPQHKRSRSNASLSSNSPPRPSSSSRLPHHFHEPPSPLDLDGRLSDQPRSSTNGGAWRENHRERLLEGAKPRNGERDKRGTEKDRDRDRDQDRERKPPDKGTSHRTRSRSPSTPANDAKSTRPDRNKEQARERLREDGGPLRTSLPPVLSPLHFNPDRNVANRDANGTGKRPRSASAVASSGSMANGKQSPSSTGSRASPVHIPPLLSPTLPAIVEIELSRLRKTPPEQDTAPPRPNPGGSEKKTTAEAPTGGDGVSKEAATRKSLPVDAEKGTPMPTPAPTASSRAPLLVTMKYKKKNAKRVVDLLALRPSPAKTKRPPESNTPPAAAPTKRPTSAASNNPTPFLAASPSSFKQFPKAVAGKSLLSAPRASAAPSTPLKATGMARAASSHSQGLTPGGESAGYTPGSSERRPTSQGEPSNSSIGTASEYRHRFDAYLKLGTKLKHDRDAIVKSKMANGVAKGDSSGVVPVPVLTLADKKLVAALSVEMVMSYMIAFRSFNHSRYLDRKPGDVEVWERLLPHLAELRSHARHFRALEGLALQLRALCYEQMLAAYVGHDAEAVATRLLAATKHRIDAWAEAASCVDAVDERALKVVVGPWCSVEDGVRAMLPVLHRWNEAERAGWEQALPLPGRG